MLSRLPWLVKLIPQEYFEKMKRLPRPLTIAVILVALIAATPLALPYSLFQPRLTAHLAQRFGSKVEIGAIGFSYLPTPAFSLKQVMINSPEAARIGSIEIPLSLHNVLFFGKELRGIRARDVMLSRHFAVSLPERIAQQTDMVKLGDLQLENLHLKMEPGEAGPFSGTLEFSPDGRISQLTVPSQDGKLTLKIQPAEPGAFDMQFAARNWPLPFAWPVEFDYINLTGKATGEALQISDIHAGLYKGVVTGNATLQWGRHWKLDGRIQAKNLQAAPLVTLFSPILHISGILDGEGHFAYEADDHIRLFSRPALQGRFTARDGLLHNIDLITPMKSQTSETVHHGGQTRFDTLSGALSLQNDTLSLRQLQLDTGKFRASGELMIRDGRILGEAVSTLNAGLLTVTSRFRLDGRPDAPELHSGGAWRSQTDSAVAPEQIRKLED